MAREKDGWVKVPSTLIYAGLSDAELGFYIVSLLVANPRGSAREGFVDLSLRDLASILNCSHVHIRDMRSRLQARGLIDVDQTGKYYVNGYKELQGADPPEAALDLICLKQAPESIKKAVREKRSILARRTALRQFILARDHNRCRYCGDRVARRRVRIDRVYPDGTDTVDNLATCCPSCDNRKGHMTPEEAGMALQAPLPLACSSPLTPSKKCSSPLTPEMAGADTKLLTPINTPSTLLTGINTQGKSVNGDLQSVNQHLHPEAEISPIRRKKIKK